LKLLTISSAIGNSKFLKYKSSLGRQW